MRQLIMNSKEDVRDCVCIFTFVFELSLTWWWTDGCRRCDYGSWSCTVKMRRWWNNIAMWTREEESVMKEDVVVEKNQWRYELQQTHGAEKDTECYGLNGRRYTEKRRMTVQSEAEAMLNDRRPITTHASAVWKKKADVWKVLNEADERSPVHSSTTIMQDFCGTMGLTACEELWSANHVPLSIASLAKCV